MVQSTVRDAGGATVSGESRRSATTGWLPSEFSLSQTALGIQQPASGPLQWFRFDSVQSADAVDDSPGDDLVTIEFTMVSGAIVGVRVPQVYGEVVVAALRAAAEAALSTSAPLDQDIGPDNGRRFLVHRGDIAAMDRTGPPTTASPPMSTPLFWSAPAPPSTPSGAVEPPPFPPRPATQVSPQGLDASRTVAAASASLGSSETTEKERRSAVRILALAAVGLLVVGLVAATLMYRSKYEASSELADQTAAQLDATSAELKTSEATLAKTTTDLAAMTSERDGQTQRVTELSNEKAQVQDERNASQELARLGAVAAQEMQDCRNQLLDVMSAMLDSSVYVVSPLLDAVVPVCQSANSSVAAFADAAG